ncbi:MAG: hypothetical protein JNG85_11790, partial [Spirochaetaceae bacterium]|nr:hypothetical protein [Spirochaetaceae bacterium]
RLSARFEALGVTGPPREELQRLHAELHARVDLLTGGVRALLPPPSGAAPGSFEAEAPHEAFLREFVGRFDVASLVIRACLVAILFILVFALYRLRASSSEYRRAKEAEEDRVRERAAVEEAERSRIARELHDEGLQGIIGARMVLERYAPGMDGEEAAALVDLARASLASSLASLREVLGSLSRPANPPPAGFLASLRALAARLSPVGSVRIEVEGPEPELEPAAAAALLKIAEEAAWNAMRHSGCSRILCRTERSGGDWLLHITDNGRWREPGEDGRTRLGLAGMRERAAAAGLSLGIEGGEGGTKVLVAVPAPAPAAAGGGATAPPRNPR